MDWSEDRQLLSALEKEPINKISELEKSLIEQQAELTKRFRIIAEQADIIKRYRVLVKKLIAHPKEDHSIAEKKNIEKIEEKEANQVVPERMAKMVINNPSPPPPKRPKSPESKTSPTKLRRLNQLIEQSKIKYPTQSDGYRETAIGQTIWDTIIKCFRKQKGAMITEKMIIEESGHHALIRPNELFLNQKMISSYFTFPFTFSDSEQTMTVRPLTTAQGQSWLVIMPDWLKSQIVQDVIYDIQN